MPSIKDRLLIGLATKGQVENARDLELIADADEHAITHVLYSLNKQGLVGFKTRKVGRWSLLTKIALTPNGEEAARRAQR